MGAECLIVQRQFSRDEASNLLQRNGESAFIPIDSGYLTGILSLKAQSNNYLQLTMPLILPNLIVSILSTRLIDQQQMIWSKAIPLKDLAGWLLTRCDIMISC